jgi:phenylpropionate dioxygenase-like ring-hydroxylating dioxygenase large terminal subunit
MHIPSGWYFCADSSEIKAGQVVRKELFGRTLVLWRTESGILRISDAVCPHLGSDLGKLGRVKGETLQCYSHRYTYDGAGDCVETGYKTLPCRTEKVLHSYPVHEISGFVLAWYDPQRREPTWRIPDEVFENENKGRFVRSQYVFDVPVEILNEDNFDAAHLYTWHECKEVKSSAARVDGPTISITHDFKRHSILFQEPLPPPFDILSREVTSRYGSTLYGHGLTYSFIDIFNFDYHLQDFIFVTPITATKTLYTTFLRRILPTGERSLTQRFVDKVIHPALFPIIVRRLRQEHVTEGHGFWEAQSRVESPILTERERVLIEPYREWCRQFDTDVTRLPLAAE